MNKTLIFTLGMMGAVGYVTAFTLGTPIPWSRQWKYLEAGNVPLGIKGLPKVHKAFIDAAVFNTGPLAHAKKK